LISAIEGQPRGVYSGAIGFFSKSETIFNVAIRTLTLQGEAPSQVGTFGVGSGIVIDSNASDEYRECLLKADFLMGLSKNTAHRLADSFSLVETLLWSEEFPFIEQHLDRLEDSALYFGYPFNRADANSALLSFAARHRPREPHKIRLLHDRDGLVTITQESLPDPISRPLRVTISSQRTDPQDPMYFHKTTFRPIYTEALDAAIQAGYDDVLFVNLRGEVTESAIHNIFVELDGRLITPPITSGLLAGVYRRHLLASRPNAEERVLTLKDLRQADAIYLCNAVRGLRQAVIDWVA